MQTIIIIALVIVILAIWISSVRRKLAVMEETADNNMNQIGVQLSSRFDALLALLELTKGYFEIESAALIEGIKSRRSFINAQSTPDAVLKQESVISEALSRISVMAEHYPGLKAEESYLRCIDAVLSFEKMIQTSRLIYNDSVTKLNRAIRKFPTNLIAGILGFHTRGYLEALEEEDSAGVK